MASLKQFDFCRILLHSSWFYSQTTRSKVAYEGSDLALVDGPEWVYISPGLLLQRHITDIYLFFSANYIPVLPVPR